MHHFVPPVCRDLIRERGSCVAEDLREPTVKTALVALERSLAVSFEAQIWTDLHDVSSHFHPRRGRAATRCHSIPLRGPSNRLRRPHAYVRYDGIEPARRGERHGRVPRLARQRSRALQTSQRRAFRHARRPRAVRVRRPRSLTRSAQAHTGVPASLVRAESSSQAAWATASIEVSGGADSHPPSAREVASGSSETGPRPRLSTESGPSRMDYRRRRRDRSSYRPSEWQKTRSGLLCISLCCLLLHDAFEHENLEQLCESLAHKQVRGLF